MIRLYISSKLNIGQNLTLPLEQTHYLVNVMRCKRGDQILLFNGVDGEFVYELSDLHKKGVTGYILHQTRPYTPFKELNLIFAPIKPNRLHFMIEKATEVGVTNLQPVITHNTTIKRVNVQRLERIATEAAEQSERLCIPRIHEPMDLIDYMNAHPKPDSIVWAYERLSGHVPITGCVNSLLVGPEGGFTTQECIFLQNKCRPIWLGFSILRAETAAIVGLDRISLHNKDMT